MPPRMIAFILAGGRGSRLYPLTKERAKPALPFGGKFRIIDFALSNLVNSGIYSIYVLTQYKSQSLLRHLRDGWQFGGLLKDQFIVPVPAQMRTAAETWYQGTADAIYQNSDFIEKNEEHLVLIFGADHVYRMNISQMVEFHRERHAEVTVAACPVEARLSTEFGVIEAAPDGTIVGFHEKKPDAPTIRGESLRVYASMGNYIFSSETLLRELGDDARREDSRHDFGHDILPSMLGRARMYAYDFQENQIPGEPANWTAYWKDVGTLEEYYATHMDLCGVMPDLNLYNPRWPIQTASYPDPSAKFTFGEEGRPGQAIGSVISGGCILSGGLVRNSILGRGVHVHEGAVVEESIIFDNCHIGPRARIRRTILDEGVVVPNDAVIGHDMEQDHRQYYVSPSGIVVVEGHPSVL
jgi:glucose-1-phosphate adenylyltransferase